MNEINIKICNILDGYYKTALLDGLQSINFKNIIKNDDNVLIKPNLTWPIYKKGVTTNPELLDALTELLKNRCNKLYIAESDGANFGWTANEAFKGHNLDKIAKRNGFELINLTNQPTIEKKVAVDNQVLKFKVSKYIIDNIDVFITVPVLKVHAATTVSLGLKNQWGCLPDPMRLLYHPNLNKGIVVINKIYNPKISIIDSMYGLNRTGPIFGDPIKLNKIFISNNITALDIIACSFMGFPYKKVNHIKLAKKEFLKEYPTEKLINNSNIEPVYKFYLNKTISDKISLLIMFHNNINKLFYKSKFSNSIQKLLDIYRITFKKKVGY